MYYGTSAIDNTANGDWSLYSNTIGSNNTANGHQALWANIAGNNNTADGEEALHNATNGSNNIALGYQAGYNLTNGSNNIYLGNLGVSDDNNLMRLGTPGVHTTTVIAGVINGNGSGLTNLSANAITGGLTTNIAVLVPGGGTNTLFFANGVLKAIQ